MIGRNPELVAETIRQARLQREGTIQELEVDARALRSSLVRIEGEIHAIAGVPGENALAKLAFLQDRARREHDRLDGIMQQIDDGGAKYLNEQALVRALSDFDGIWDVLRGEEREKLIRLLIRRVGYNAQSGEVQIQFHTSGLSDFIISQAL